MNGHTTARGSIVGVVSAVPAQRITNADCPDPAAADEAAKMTGVFERRWVTLDQSSRSLCTAAALKLLDKLDWPSDTVDLFVYVTQTPDGAVPADAYRIAVELGLPTRCMVLQANWSCSGYVYGLLAAMRLLDPGKRALLLVGDATSKITDPGDRATAPLFGDAGSATAIVGSDVEQKFVVGTDGSGFGDLNQGLREFLHMDGAAVFSFTLKQVPRLVEDVLSYGMPDYLLFHQAQAFILTHLVKKMKLHQAYESWQIPMNVERFGNCSSASIPLLMCTGLGPYFPQRLALFGYGAGFAWCGASIDCDPKMVFDLLEI